MPHKDREVTRVKHRAYALTHYYKAKDNKGLEDCSTCSGKRDDSRFKKCSKCRKYMQEYKRLRSTNPEYVADKRSLCKGRPKIHKEPGECKKPSCHNKPIPPLLYCTACNEAKYITPSDSTRAAANGHNREAKRAALAAYGGKCACCGETRKEFLSIDHINGFKGDTPRSGYGLYRWLRRNRYPEGFRVLCMSCNFSLGHVGYCSHSNLTQVTNLGRPRVNKVKVKNASEWRRALKRSVIDAYGGPLCACCGDTDIHRLSIDHIDNNGAEHRRQVGQIYPWLRNNGYPAGFQVLCINCNFAKGLYGQCPHITNPV